MASLGRLLALFVVSLNAWLVASREHRNYINESENAMNSTHHPKPWMILEEFDGLKNNDIVLLISGSSSKKFTYLRESARTWMKFFANAFVIVEDNFQTRHAFRFCRIRETPHFTSFDCHNEPTYVLSRKCIASKGGGPGPCCKVDELFTYLMVDRPDVYSHTRYVIHGDDDNFIRVEELMRFIAKFESLGLSSIPIVGGPEMAKGDHVYGVKGCHEIHVRNWYQPLFINRAAMELMKVAFSSYGVWETCDNFHVTHDVGLGPFLWMFGVYHVRFPGWLVTNHDTRIGGIVTHKVVHGSGRDNCDNLTAYSESQRYNQKILLGCGDVHELQASHTADQPDGSRDGKMYNDNYELWQYFKAHPGQPNWGIHAIKTWDTFNVTLYSNGSHAPGDLPGEENKYRIKYVLQPEDVVAPDGTFKGDRVTTQNLPILTLLNGYDTTNHSKIHNVVQKWVGFKISDCAPVS